MKHIFYLFSILLVLVGCGPKTTAEGDPIIKSGEDFLRQMDAHPLTGAPFRLAISDSFTFNEQRGETGAGTALFIAELIKRGYLMDGKPEQKRGFRIIQFKKTQ